MPKPTAENTATAVERIANIALDFTAAQQAANVAYDMTIEATGDFAQASDDYKAAMTAYHSQSRRKVLRVADTKTEQSVTYYNDWATFVKRVEQTDTLPMMGDRD